MSIISMAIGYQLYKLFTIFGFETITNTLLSNRYFFFHPQSHKIFFVCEQCFCSNWHRIPKISSEIVIVFYSII